MCRRMPSGWQVDTVWYINALGYDMDGESLHMLETEEYPDFFSFFLRYGKYDGGWKSIRMALATAWNGTEWVTRTNSGNYDEGDYRWAAGNQYYAWIDIDDNYNSNVYIYRWNNGAYEPYSTVVNYKKLWTPIATDDYFVAQYEQISSHWRGVYVFRYDGYTWKGQDLQQMFGTTLGEYGNFKDRVGLSTSWLAINKDMNTDHDLLMYTWDGTEWDSVGYCFYGNNGVPWYIAVSPNIIVQYHPARNIIRLFGMEKQYNDVPTVDTLGGNVADVFTDYSYAVVDYGSNSTGKVYYHKGEILEKGSENTITMGTGKNNYAEWECISTETSDEHVLSKRQGESCTGKARYYTVAYKILSDGHNTPTEWKYCYYGGIMDASNSWPRFRKARQYGPYPWTEFHGNDAYSSNGYQEINYFNDLDNCVDAAFRNLDAAGTHGWLKDGVPDSVEVRNSQTQLVSLSKTYTTVKFPKPGAYWIQLDSVVSRLDNIWSTVEYKYQDIDSAGANGLPRVRIDSPGNGIKRRSVTEYLYNHPNLGDTIQARNQLTLVRRQAVEQDSSGNKRTVAQTEYAYDFVNGYQIRDTCKIEYSSISPVVTHNTRYLDYDEYGNVTRVENPSGTETCFEWSADL